MCTHKSSNSIELLNKFEYFDFGFIFYLINLNNIIIIGVHYSVVLHVSKIFLIYITYNFMVHILLDVLCQIFIF